MAIQQRKRLIFRWTTPKNLLAILLFIILTIIVEFIIITFAIPTAAKDPTATTLSLLNVTISLLYHIIPAAVIVTLTTSFTHLATHTANIPKKTQIPKKPQTQKSTRLKPLRQFHKKIRRATRKIKTKILKTPAIAYIKQRITLAKAIIKSATTITLTFIIIITLVTIAAYPKIIPTATADFYHWNTVFLSFVTTTIKASETIANTIPPIGAVATAIHNALIAAAPTFRNTLEAAASAITSGLVSLNPTEKYLIIQNAAAWIIAIATLSYSQYIKNRRYRR
ncbi:MAG: hypothetical protein OEY24_06690 [Candidatus Bathyarchaeota archaeon]|nr:hypothetical protein [Candidatus Bathyarchaeota archaeon]